MAEPFVDILVDRIIERISLEFGGFWAREDLVEELPALIREEFEATQNQVLTGRM